jgi:transposase InsO family protein
MHSERANFPISFMVAELGVSRQGYYAWAARQGEPPRPRAAANQALLGEITSIFHAKRRRYGAPRMTDELRRRGWQVSRKRVARLMAAAGLVGRRGRRWLPRTTITDPAAAPADNVVNRDFAPDRPDATWVTDITYLRTDEGWLYLAAIIDCYSRLVVGWSTATHMRDDLCLDALDGALFVRNPDPNHRLVHHSDRGSQYTSHAYRKRLRDNKITTSMSRKGNCWDNAVAESFWATVKRELVDDQRWETRAALNTALFEYIEIFYNRERLHSSLDYSTPAEYDGAYWESRKVS